MLLYFLLAAVLTFNITPLVSHKEARTEGSSLTAPWKSGDMIGVAASYGDGSSFTDKYFQHFKIEGADGYVGAAELSGALKDCGAGTYNYYAFYPYEIFIQSDNASKVAARLEERQFPELKRWDRSCDFMTSKQLSSDAQNANFNMTRLFGMLKLSFSDSILGKYGDEIIENISIEDLDGNTMSGLFMTDLTADRPEPVFSNTDERSSKIILDYFGKQAKLSDVTAYFVMNPGKYDSVRIQVKTNRHLLSFDRNRIKVTKGAVTPSVLSLKPTDSVEEAAPILPENPKQLRVLVFGHSFIQDCMEYIDDLMNDAGIKNVTFSYFYAADCSLTQYWAKTTDAGNTKGGSAVTQYIKNKYNDSTGKVETVITDKTVIDALCDEDWDVVMLQTRLEDEGFYDKITGDGCFDSLRSYILDTCQKEHGREPLIGWHTFWAYGTHYQNAARQEMYLYDQDLNHTALVQATKDMMRKKGIDFVIPSCTTLRYLRRTPVCNAYTPDARAYEFSRDGYHMDKGAGRYAAACTWFEAFMKPCFGISVYGNRFIPSDFTALAVTKDNKETIQKAAVSAVNDRF